MKLIASISLGLAAANYNSLTYPADNLIIQWVDEANHEEFIQRESHKPYVQYQAPDDEYVPIRDLPIIFLNGIKFRRQGRLPRPDQLDRFRKVTRSGNGHLTCMDNDKVPKGHGGHSSSDEHGAMLSDVYAPFEQEEAEPLQRIVYPRYNGAKAPLPPSHMGLEDHEEEEEEEEEFAEEDAEFVEEAAAHFELGGVDPIDGGVVSDEFEEPEEDPEIMVNLVGEPSEDELVPQNKDEMTMSRDELRLVRLRKKFFDMKNVKIGCCNGQAYNSQKRCCCRRVSFDMDKKFCCAINGCESFKIMNRGSIQDYNDCLSLQGLVVQEYGYQGQRGQPKIFGDGRG